MTKGTSVLGDDDTHNLGLIKDSAVSKVGVIKAVGHGLSRTAIAKVQHGTGKGAFLSGFVSSGFSVGAIKMAIVGGTASAIGGGKFANGAMGSAFQYLYNNFDPFTGGPRDIVDDIYGAVEEGFNSLQQTAGEVLTASVSFVKGVNRYSTMMAGLTATEGGWEAYYWGGASLISETILVFIGEQGAVASTVNAINGAVIDTTIAPSSPKGKLMGEILKERVKIQ